MLKPQRHTQLLRASMTSSSIYRSTAQHRTVQLTLNKAAKHVRADQSAATQAKPTELARASMSSSIFSSLCSQTKKSKPLRSTKICNHIQPQIIQAVQAANTPVPLVMREGFAFISRAFRGSGQTSRVGSGQQLFQISRVGSGRVKRFFKITRVRLDQVETCQNFADPTRPDP